MRIQIAARHMQLTDALREHVHRRFLDTLPLHYDRDSCDLRVEIHHAVGASKRRYEAVRAQLTVPGGVLVAHGRGKDAFVAVDAAQKQLLRRLDEWHRRVQFAARYPKKYYAARLVEEGRLPGAPPPGAEPTRAGGAEALAPEGAAGALAVAAPFEAAEALAEEEAEAMEEEAEATEEVAPELAEAPPPFRRPQELLELLATRRTVRRFRAAPVPEPLIEALEESLSYAPSAGNLESRRFYFVRKPRVRRLLAACTRGGGALPDAPLLVVCCAHLGSASLYHQRGLEVYAPMDVAAAIENLLLVAHAAGLGAAWVGEVDETEVALALGLQSEIRPLAIVAIGWPAEQPETPPHLPRSELVQER